MGVDVAGWVAAAVAVGAVAVAVVMAGWVVVMAGKVVQGMAAAVMAAGGWACLVPLALQGSLAGRPACP
jgi:hypothetical protein